MQADMTPRHARGRRAPGCLWMWASAAVLGLGLLAGCQGRVDGEPAGSTAEQGDGANGLPSSPDGDEPVSNVLALVPSEKTQAAAQTYLTLCSACHGDWGEGSSAPSLWKMGLDRDALVDKIDRSMPPKDPTLCTGQCAEDLADYVLTQFSEKALACEGITPSPRQLRLLNRREYANTVRTLFGLSDTQDGSATKSAKKCGDYTFRYAGNKDAASVSVAGTFNDWSETAWPMTYSAAAGAWVLTKPLENGEYELKYVVHQTAGDQAQWVVDATLPSTQNNGNSLLRLDCTDGGTTAPTTLDLSKLPLETRPQAYAFDTSVASAVGTAQFEAYFDTAKALVGSLPTPESVVSCDFGVDRVGCAHELVTGFGKRVFRRPLSADEAKRYESLFASVDDVVDAVRTTLTAMLVSPHFLYRTEIGVAQADGSYLLTPYEIASALSYLFLADMPDEQLLMAADKGELGDEGAIRAQAERLLKNKASRVAVSDFVLQWLGVAGVAALQRDPTAFPDFNLGLAQDMREETRSFAEHVVFESKGTLNELLTADYTFVNTRLAKHYGMTGDFGDKLALTPYQDDRRAGVLGHASVLSVFAHSNQTSPVLRGLFVRRQVMCQRFGDPPPNAGAVPTPDPSMSTRERFDMHAQDSCASCHKHIDPLGFGFEHFDVLGRGREMDGTHPIDANGELSGSTVLSDEDAQAFDSPQELSTLLVDSPATHACASKQSYRFMRGALDNGLQYCAVKFVRQRYRESGGKILSALLAAVESIDFRYRY